jgi:hypothetical protein
MPDYSKTRIQLRRGTSAEWNTANPTLGAAELGFDSASGVLKIGDGTKNWHNLPTQIKSDASSIAGASGIANIVFMTQAAYDALGSYDATTVYYIV